MNQEEALGMLVNEVYMPVFVKAARELGVTMSSAENVQHGLEIVAKLKEIEYQGAEQADSNLLKEAHKSLFGAEATPAPAAPPELNEALNALR